MQRVSSHTLSVSAQVESSEKTNFGQTIDTTPKRSSLVENRRKRANRRAN